MDEDPDPERERDDTAPAAGQPDAARAGGSLAASEQADNSEIQLDPELEGDDPEREAGRHAERLERHTERTDTPAHHDDPR